ncbi:hypothetical protein N657DRAFT_178022 [Parathielavia appendiculata]|uniref:Uncharacterized protein n=1 Tax=Parathielavia appendiculata TaxID=2587402 RepID=A0AAN6U6E9_9PEZI|nr:hypothetical protein N657DRAFT_178022 [Parathielavia appendiculata]
MSTTTSMHPMTTSGLQSSAIRQRGRRKRKENQLMLSLLNFCIYICIYKVHTIPGDCLRFLGPCYLGVSNVTRIVHCLQVPYHFTKASKDL